MIDLVLTDDNIKAFQQAIKVEMEKSIKHFERELTTIRTGRAHASLVEGLIVKCYGGTQPMKLRDIASIAAPDVRLITIQPWDVSVLADIERAIEESDLGLSPDNDGSMIRLVLPEMSSERREELVKILKKKCEDTKVAIRNVRKDFQNLVRDSLKDKNISEDHSRRLTDALQKLTDENIALTDTMATKKTNEIKAI